MITHKELRKRQRRNNKRYLRTKIWPRNSFKYFSNLIQNDQGSYTLNKVFSDEYKKLGIFSEGVTKEEMPIFSGRPYPDPIISNMESFIITSRLKDMPDNEDLNIIVGSLNP